MKNNNKKDILDKFKKLEGELIELLATPIKFDEETKKEVVRKELKRYVSKMQKLRVAFDEYEELAKQIESLIREDSSKFDVKAVVDLRDENENVDNKEMINDNSENLDLEKEASNMGDEEYKDEVLMQGNEVVILKKKKKVQSKEL